jgi:hypothetical protein
MNVLVEKRPKDIGSMVALYVRGFGEEGLWA